MQKIEYKGGKIMGKLNLIWSACSNLSGTNILERNLCQIIFDVVKSDKGFFKLFCQDVLKGSKIDEFENADIDIEYKVEEFSIVQPTFILGDYDSKPIQEYNQKILEHIKEPLSFSEIEECKLKLKIKMNCILEINEKYCATASSNSNCVKIFHMQNGFKEVITIPDIQCNEGNCILSLSKDRNYLFVATLTGFNIITIDNLKKNRKYTLNQSILCLDFYKPECIVTAALKNDEFYIKQYNFKNDFKDISKFSESKTYSAEKINNLKVIKNKIYYLNDTCFLHYFEKEQIT